MTVPAGLTGPWRSQSGLHAFQDRVRCATHTCQIDTHDHAQVFRITYPHQAELVSYDSKDSAQASQFGLSRQVGRAASRVGKLSIWLVI
jgi:hypothetical protein